MHCTIPARSRHRCFSCPQSESKRPPRARAHGTCPARLPASASSASVASTFFCPLASASSKPESANEVSKDLLFLPSFSPKSCWNIVSVSIKTMSSSLPAGSSFAPCDAFSASRCNFNAAVARSNCSVFAAALGSSASSSSSSSSSSPFLSSLSSSASRSPPPRTDAQRLERVSAGMKSPSSRQAARAASLTRPEPLTKSSAAMRGTTVRASEIAFCTLPDLFCFDCAFVEAATNFPKAVSNS
mmetsp:Transcript_41571/g.134307  ORF Transcript_41571/g.134307 Transcript_41571/m.134307 type:complete len:243 (+) Transcript_41571:1218-1946(+)